MSRFQRSLGEGREQRASNLELFYDLVFVFAVTQVSHLLLDDLTWGGAGRAALVLLVVWWAWNYTTWVTNELDTEADAVRLVLLAIMFASLMMAVAIPDSFGDRALLFAGSYVAIQVGRHVFLTFVVASRGTIERERALQILVWFVASGALWIIGALVGGDGQVAIWLGALAIDYVAPVAVYWVPGRPRLTHETWQVETSHFAERFQLFMIIALGETIVITGATTAQLELDLARLTAFALAFLGTAAFWWLYFTYVASIAQRRLELADDRTIRARNGYTYLHVVFVAGVIVAAVGDELVIAHPTDRLGTAAVLTVVAGPALYLVGLALFRLAMAGTIAWRRLGGALVCLALGLLGPVVSGVMLLALVVVVLVAVIWLDRLAARRRVRRGEPSPHELLERAAADRS